MIYLYQLDGLCAYGLHRCVKRLIHWQKYIYIYKKVPHTSVGQHNSTTGLFVFSWKCFCVLKTSLVDYSATCMWYKWQNSYKRMEYVLFFLDTLKFHLLQIYIFIQDVPFIQNFSVMFYIKKNVPENVMMWYKVSLSNTWLYCRHISPPDFTSMT